MPGVTAGGYRSERMAAGAAWLAAAVAGAGAVAATPAAAAEFLSAAQLQSMVVGSTIRYQDDDKDVVDEFYAADGTVRGRSRSAGPYRATWQIRFGNLFCIVQSDPMQSGCVNVVVNGRRIAFHRRDGVVEGPFELRAGDPERLGRGD